MSSIKSMQDERIVVVASGKQEEWLRRRKRDAMEGISNYKSLPYFSLEGMEDSLKMQQVFTNWHFALLYDSSYDEGLGPF